MKIGPLESKPVGTLPAERKTAPGSAPASAPTSTGVEPSAQVALSPAATALSKPAANAGVGSSGDASIDGSFDTSKVERIAQAIRDGKFKVNPEAIADKLVINAKELLGRKLS